MAQRRSGGIIGWRSIAGAQGQVFATAGHDTYRRASGSGWVQLDAGTECVNAIASPKVFLAGESVWFLGDDGSLASWVAP